MKSLMLSGPRVVLRFATMNNADEHVAITLFDGAGRHEVTIDRAEERRLLAWMRRLELERDRA